MMEEFKNPIRPEAVWLDKDCPKCSHPFIAKDKFGEYCCNSACNWTSQNEEKKDNRKRENRFKYEND